MTSNENTPKKTKERGEGEEIKIQTAKPILCSSIGDTVDNETDAAAKKLRDKTVGLEIVSKTDDLASKKDSRKRLELAPPPESDKVRGKIYRLAKSSGYDATKIEKAVASSLNTRDSKAKNVVERGKETKKLAYAPPIECEGRRGRVEKDTQSGKIRRKICGLEKSSSNDATTKTDKAVASSVVGNTTDSKTENMVERSKEAKKIAYAPSIEYEARRGEGEKNTQRDKVRSKIVEYEGQGGEKKYRGRR